MSLQDLNGIAPLRLMLPATSANLGPGFDALGLAMDFALHIKAETSGTDSIVATGRDIPQVSDLSNSLVLRTYRDVLHQQGAMGPPLRLEMHNEIPLGMGCGSSASAILAGVALANHFGQLGWDTHGMLTESALREGHPDNVAACALGGLTASAMLRSHGASSVSAIATSPAVHWPLLLVMPETSLSTVRARALLPESYSRQEAVANLQRVALLVAAFAQGRAELLAEAMTDTMHQPYRAEACPLLVRLLPLAGRGDVLGVALSGAGPSVLMILREKADVRSVETQVRTALGSELAELMETRMGGAAVLLPNSDASEAG